MNFGAMQTQVQVVLGDENESLVTKTNIKVWLNQGYREIARRVGGIFTTVTATTVSAPDNTYTLPTLALGIERILWDGVSLWPNNWNNIRNFVIPDGTPYSFYVIGGNVVGFYPKPTTTSGLNIRVDYRAIPSDLSADGDVTTLPDIASDAMIEYALERAYRLSSQLELMSAAKIAYEEKVQYLISEIGSSADMLSYPQIIDVNHAHGGTELGWPY